MRGRANTPHYQIFQLPAKAYDGLVEFWHHWMGIVGVMTFLKWMAGWFAGADLPVKYVFKATYPTSLSW